MEKSSKTSTIVSVVWSIGWLVGNINRKCFTVRGHASFYCVDQTHGEITAVSHESRPISLTLTHIILIIYKQNQSISVSIRACKHCNQLNSVRRSLTVCQTVNWFHVHEII